MTTVRRSVGALIPLSWAYGVSCRARAERAALRACTTTRFAPRTVVGSPASRLRARIQRFSGGHANKGSSARRRTESCTLREKIGGPRSGQGSAAAFVAGLLFDGALGRRLRLQASVGNRLAALDRKPVGPVRQALLGPLHRCELVTQVLTQARVALVLVELAGLIAEVGVEVGQLAGVLRRQVGERLLDPRPLPLQERACSVGIHVYPVFPATAPTNAATSWASLPDTIPAGMVPLPRMRPVSIAFRTSAAGGLSWSRFGPTLPWVRAAARVWQLLQRSPKSWRPCSSAALSLMLLSPTL